MITRFQVIPKTSGFPPKFHKKSTKLDCGQNQLSQRIYRNLLKCHFRNAFSSVKMLRAASSKCFKIISSKILTFPLKFPINHSLCNYIKLKSHQRSPYRFKYFFRNVLTIKNNHVPKKSGGLTMTSGQGGKAEPKRMERGVIKDTLLGPPRKNPPNKIGQGVIATSAFIALGGLCYHGLEISGDSGIENLGVWRSYIRDRLKTTFAYFGASVLWTGGTTLLAFQSRTVLRMLTRNAFVALGASLVCQIISGIVVINTTYEPGLGFKQLAWIVHTCTMGVAIAPMCFIGGPVIVKAFTLTAGVIGGLSTIAYCAPQDKFLSWSGPCAIVLGCLFTSAFGSFFLPPTARIGTGLFAVYLYGGLLLFSVMLMFDTKTIIRRAEMVPYDDPRGFDPINAAMSLNMDALNVFVRFVQMLALREVKKRQDK